MTPLKNFIDNYLNVNKKVTLAILTVEHNNKRNIDIFLENLKLILVFDYYDITRKEFNASTVTTLVLIIKNIYPEEEVKKLIHTSVKHIKESKEETLLLLHRDIYVDSFDVIHPLAQIQISYAVLIVKEHLKIKKIN